MIPELPKKNLLDKALEYFSPSLGVKRMKSRMGMASANSIFYGGRTGFPIPGQTARRAMRGYNPTNNSADVDVTMNLQAIRSGARDMYMNTPAATAVLRRAKTNVIGTGLRLQARPDREYLGLKDEEADAWEKLVEREFSYWAESYNCDLTRTQNFYDLQALAFLSVLMNGDAFVILPMKKVADSPYALRIKLYEGDQCVSPNGDDITTGKVLGGIKLDDDGAPVEYYFAKKHPGDGTFSNIATDTVTIPAFGAQSGRRNVLHLMFKERIGQRRGAPILAPVLEQLKQASRLTDAELMASVVNACFTVFITSPGADAPFNNGFFPGVGGTQDAPGGEGNEKVLNPAVRPADEKNIELGNGSVVQLADGEKIESASPSRPNAGFEPFFNAIMKQIGSSIGIPYEVLMLNFNSSYSASRAALLEAWKLFREWRMWMSRGFCQPIYEEFLMEAVLTGRVSAPGFLDDPIVRASWSWTKWSGPGMGMIDPLKEVQASAMRIEKRLSTYEEEKNAMDGGNWDDMIQRASREDRILTEKKLKPIPETPPRASQPKEPDANE